jgi:hypothetical protein
MRIDLSSVNAKLRRAKEHRDALKVNISKWYELKPWRFVQESSADHAERILFIERSIDTSPDIELWSLQFGDAIHNLGAVLDHLIYAIAVYQNGRNPPQGSDPCVSSLKEALKISPAREVV